MKHKIAALIVILSYLCSMYGLKGVEEWIGWVAMLLPFVAMIIWFIISTIFNFLIGEGEINETTTLYVSFVFSIFCLILFHRETDFIIGRIIMWLGGTSLYISRLISDREKRDEEVKTQFYYDLKSGKVGVKDGFIL